MAFSALLPEALKMNVFPRALQSTAIDFRLRIALIYSFVRGMVLISGAVWTPAAAGTDIVYIFQGTGSS